MEKSGSELPVRDERVKEIMPQAEAQAPGLPADEYPGFFLPHEQYWKFSVAPFENVPDPLFYYPCGKHEDARQRLLYGVRAKKGLVMVTGEIGCGKTLLSRALIQGLSPSGYDVGLVVNPALPSHDFLLEILYQFGLEASGQKVELLHRLNEHLLANHSQARHTVLVIDEAQSIIDDHTFEDLRLLLNFQLNHRFLLTIVLLGQPELRKRVQAIPQLNQRISIRYHLAPLTIEETYNYIRFRVRTAGGDEHLFTQDAVYQIFQLTGGVSRLINTLCDACLFLGAEERAQQVDSRLVRLASRMM